MTTKTKSIGLRVLKGIVEHEGWTLLQADGTGGVAVDPIAGGTLVFIVLRERENTTPGPEQLTLDEYTTLLGLQDTFESMVAARRNDLCTVLVRDGETPLIRWTTHVALPTIQ